MNNRLKLFSAVLLVVFAGCAGGVADDGIGSAGGAESASLIVDAFGSAETEQTDGDDLLQAQRRVVIKGGRIESIVGESNESCGTVKSIAESYGGYVSDSNEYVNRRSGGTYHSGQLVMRVFFEDFSTFTTDMEALGEVEHVEMNSEDVTNRLVDTEARLSNPRVQRDCLRDLYESANTTENVSVVGGRLMDVQTEIERLEVQKQSLEDRVALSTVWISLSERPPGPAQWYDTLVLQAFSESVNGTFAALRVFVIAVTYAAPYLAVFGGLLAIFGSGVVSAGRIAFRRLTD